MFRFLAVLVFFCLIFGRLDRLFFKQNGSFCPSFILPNWSRCPQFETDFDGSIRSIINQPFSYLTKGKQSFVFLSRDQKWVLKFIRLPRYVKRRSWKGNISSVEYLENTLRNFKWVSDSLEKETGVIYAHLQPTKFWNQDIHLIDRFDRIHRLPLDDIPFAIQRYGEPFFSSFDLQNIQEAKRIITKTVDLFLTLYEKGFIDRDPIFEKNFGIFDGEPFIMDIGQLERCDALPTRKQYIQNMTNSLHIKLSQESPDLLAHYLDLIENL